MDVAVLENGHGELLAARATLPNTFAGLDTEYSINCLILLNHLLD